MNLWRWFGAFILVVGVTCLLTTPRFPAFAQEKDKKDQKDKKDGAKDAKKDGAKDAKKDGAKDAKKDGAKDGKDAKDKKGEEKKGDGKTETLTWKAFNPDAKPFFQELKTETTQTMKVMGQEVVQKQEQTFLIEWTPQKKDDKGNYVVEQKIAGVKMTIDIGGNKISYDSTKENPKNPMTDFFKQLTQQKLTFIVSPKMKVEEVKGRKEFIKSLGETNPQMTALLNTILSEEALTKMAEPTWWALPEAPVKQGDTWKKESLLKLGPIGTYKTDFTFTYQGEEQGKDKIGIKADLSYTKPGEKERAGLPFVIKDATLTSKSGGGTAYFNRDKGRFESSVIKMDLIGDLTIEVGNMATQISLVQNQVSNSKTFDTRPEGWAEQKKQ